MNHLFLCKIRYASRSHISNQLNDCTDSRQRWLVVRELLHSAKAKQVGSLNCFSSFTTAWPHLSSPYYATPQASHRIGSLNILPSILSKTSVLDFVPISVLKSCPALFSDLIAHIANLSFSKAMAASSAHTVHHWLHTNCEFIRYEKSMKLVIVC